LRRSGSIRCPAHALKSCVSSPVRERTVRGRDDLSDLAHPEVDLLGSIGLVSGLHHFPGRDVAVADLILIRGVQVKSAFFVDSHRTPHPCFGGADVGNAFDSDLAASVWVDSFLADFAHVFHVCESTPVSPSPGHDSLVWLWGRWPSLRRRHAVGIVRTRPSQIP
jgi:hypothetical protein